ncbi:hypothetical protein ACLBYD_19950 [Rhodococcus sp. C26F]
MLVTQRDTEGHVGQVVMEPIEDRQSALHQSSAKIEVFDVLQLWKVRAVRDDTRLT